MPEPVLAPATCSGCLPRPRRLPTVGLPGSPPSLPLSWGGNSCWHVPLFSYQRPPNSCRGLGASVSSIPIRPLIFPGAKHSVVGFLCAGL